MASTRASSKRNASQADLPNTDATVVAPAAPASATMSDVSSAELLAAGGPAPVPQVAGFTHDVPVVAEETTSHKAKRVATEAAHSVSTAVTQGFESVTTAATNAANAITQWSDKELVRTAHSNAPGATPLNSEMPVEPTLRDKTHNALNTAQFAIERAAESTLAGAKVAAAKIAEGIHTLGEKIEPHAAAIAAKSEEISVKAVNQGSIALDKTMLAGGAAMEKTKAAGHVAMEKTKAAGSAAIEKSKDMMHGSGDKHVSDASHTMEKADGSLPVERNADEFPNGRKIVSFEGDSRINAGASSVAAAPLPGQSGLGTDKVVDAPIVKADAQPDLLTGDARPLEV